MGDREYQNLESIDCSVKLDALSEVHIKFVKATG
jgi:hypothetical protein